MRKMKITKAWARAGTECPLEPELGLGPELELELELELEPGLELELEP